MTIFSQFSNRFDSLQLTYRLLVRSQSFTRGTVWILRRIAARIIFFPINELFGKL